MATIIGGLLCATLFGAAVWSVQVPKYSAVSLLQITSQEPSLVFDDVTGPGEDDFGIYKRTQQRLLLSHSFLTAAVESPALAELDLVRQHRDPASWLADRLDVSFPDDAEIMQIGLEGSSPDELAAVVDGVVDVYLKRVAAIEESRRRKRLADLDRVYTDKQSEVRGKRTALKELANRVEGDSREGFSPAQQLAMQECTDFQKAYLQQEFSLRLLQSELAAAEAEMRNPRGIEISDADLNARLWSDPVAGELFDQLDQLQGKLAHTRDVATPKSVARFTQQYSEKASSLKRQVQDRADELRAELQEAKRTEIKAEVQRLHRRIAVVSTHKQQLEADVRRQKTEVESFGKSPVDVKSAIEVEMKRAEIEQLEDVLARIARDREQLEVESGVASRSMVVQPAKVAGAGSSVYRLLAAAMAAAAGFALAAFCIIRFDGARQHVHSTAEVATRIGLEVIGTIPKMSRRVVRRFDGPAAPKSKSQRRLNDSVDRIVVSLLHRAESQRQRVLLITSAVPREGKTSLAVQLAVGLARTGHRTVLVDFNLQQPALHEALDVPLQPGVGEILRGEESTLEAARETATKDLWVLPAGTRDDSAHAALARGGAGPLFDALRNVFDFVVVDGGSILPVADTRFVSQHADAVILSVIHQVSRSPSVLAAREILASLDVHTMQSVVAGSTEESCYQTPH